MNTTTVRRVGERGKPGVTTVQVLRLLNEQMDENREVCVTLREMGAELGISTTSVNYAVRNLRLSRKVRCVRRTYWGMVYRVNPSGVTKAGARRLQEMDRNATVGAK